jgi:hypothetical protein
MKIFFEDNTHFKLKNYRSLQKNLLPLITQLRKQAMIDGELPMWTQEIEDQLRDYFLITQP